MGRGRGRRPRRPASPRTSPAVSPLASPCARRAGDVAPYHGVRWWGVVGADVLGGPRPPRVFPRTSPLASPLARRAGDVAPYQASRGCGHGRGRRPRRPATPRAFPLASPLTSPCARRAGDVAPYHGVRWWGVVGADVPAARVPEGVPFGVSVRAARRGRRALPDDAVVGHGRGRRPRRPAFPLASPLASPCARRAGDVAPDQMTRRWGMVGADVPGGPRPPRVFPRTSPLASLLARRAGDVAPYQVRAVVGHGRGRRPGGPRPLRRTRTRRSVSLPSGGSGSGRVCGRGGACSRRARGATSPPWPRGQA